MEIILFYLALFSLIAAVAGIFIPHKLVFWCAQEDRSRVMAFTVYFTLSILLTVIFVIIVPEPAPEPTPKPAVIDKKVKPPRLTEPAFLEGVKKHLKKDKGVDMSDLTFTLLSFDDSGSAVNLAFPERITRRRAVQYATAVVEAMVATYKEHGVRLKEPKLIECQIHHAVTYTNLTNPRHMAMGFARYHPDTRKITWRDYD